MNLATDLRQRRRFKKQTRLGHIYHVLTAVTLLWQRSFQWLGVVGVSLMHKLRTTAGIQRPQSRPISRSLDLAGSRSTKYGRRHRTNTWSVRAPSGIAPAWHFTSLTDLMDCWPDGCHCCTNLTEKAPRDRSRCSSNSIPHVGTSCSARCCSRIYAPGSLLVSLNSSLGLRQTGAEENKWTV